MVAGAAGLSLAACATSGPGRQDDSGQRQRSTPAASPAASGSAAPSRTTAPESAPPSRAAGSAFRLLPARGGGHLAPGSDPRALPGDVLIADEDNHRLLLVDSHGRIRWRFPAAGHLPGGHAFGPPDDAFVSPDGRTIIATQEMNDTVSLVNIASGRVTRRYGHAGRPGAARGFFSHPDDAMQLPGGDLLLADIMNCRILLMTPGRWHVIRQLGRTSSCVHRPPASFGSPNGVFPLRDGHFLVTEINGDWVDEMSLRGHVYWSAHPAGVAYPSDANQYGPGRYIVCDYSDPGQVVIFGRSGGVLWRYRPRGARALNHPSLALPLPGGNILVNDDYNDRVIVISRKTRRIIWQYGHYGRTGRAAGYLSNPDGVDLAPPYSLLIRYATAMGRP